MVNEDEDLLDRVFMQHARGEASELLTNLREIESHIELASTKARTHCYVLDCDAMGELRTQLLIEHIAARVIDYAIPRKLISEARQAMIQSGETAAWVRLQKQARSLFTRLAQSGEGGELLLYCLAETVLGYPQILTKMSLKTSSELHYNGADGVHASVDPDSKILTLWWGESKLHATAAAATTACLKSLAPYLAEPTSETSTRSRDVQLLRHGVDLDNAAIEQAIKNYLNPSHPLSKKLKYGGVGLIGFNHECYPQAGVAAIAEEITSKVEKTLETWKGHARKRVQAEKLDIVDLHLFLLPFPCVDTFRKQFASELGL